MVFGLSAAGIAAATVGAVGVGMSAAGAAGAFGGKVDAQGPTLEEMSAARDAKKAYQLGKQIQQPLDAQARSDLKYLGSDVALANAGSMGVNQFWQQLGPQFGAGLQSVAAQTGGPGSGRFWGTLGQGTSAIDAGILQANAQGRLGGLNQHLARTGQFLGRRVEDLNTGLGMMTSGGVQSQQNKQNRISAQVQNNIAANQAMGQLGGSLMGVGMSGLSAAGGTGAGAGGFGGPYGPNR